MRTIRWLLLALVVVVVAAFLLRRVFPEVEDGSALVVEISGEYVEAGEAPLVGRLLGLEQHSLVSLLSELRKAERDERLGSVILHLRDLRVGWAKLQELRDAIASLRDSGRKTVAYLEVPGFGANKEYYVASAAERVYLAPGGGPPLLGLAQQYLFLGGLWDKLDVDVQVTQAGEYKGALESFTGRKMSDAYREQAERLLDSIDAQFVSGIAESRGLDESSVRRVLAAAPSRAEVLEELGLVDGVRTQGELLKEMGDPKVIEAAEYARVDPASVGFRPEATFALIYGSGSIVSGRGSVSRRGQPIFAADTAIEALEQAAKADDIAAIVLRIDSPGGGPFPSELIWRAIREARKAKPVIASFSDYAASGGYYLASAADAIVANPATLTGSIGVFAIRPSVGGVLNRLDIGYETIVKSPHADLLLSAPPLSPETRDWLQSDVEDVYRRFVARVSEGRGRSPAEIEAVAEGRVWTGVQALDIGLVDALGGLHRGVTEAKERLGLGPEVDVALAVYPPPKPLAVQLREALRMSVAQELRAALPWGGELDRIGSWIEPLAQGGTVLVPPFWVEIR